MKYLILAAGVGSRLYPYTKNSPKCMVKVQPTETVIQRAIRLISNNDKKAKFVIVLGFCAERIVESISYDCNFVINPFYAVTNSIASLWFAKGQLVDDDLVILNADIVFSAAFAKEIVTVPQFPMVYFDSSIREHGDYNVQTMNDNMVVMGKELTNYQGEYVGITKIPQSKVKVFINEIDNMVQDGLYDQWYENALVQMSLNETIEIKAVDVCDYSWSEIDSIDNLLKIREIISRESE